MVSGDAVDVDPESNGGCGSYSMPSWIALATSSPAKAPQEIQDLVRAAQRAEEQAAA